jgi:NO-binding membrane sensor protein with MHYT domain
MGANESAAHLAGMFAIVGHGNGHTSPAFVVIFVILALAALAVTIQSVLRRRR